MAAVQITIHSKVYPSAHVATIQNFKLSLPEGEFVCLVGASGCGKTTLLNIVAQLDQDYDGQVIVEPLQQQPTIGYVFQNPRLLPWCTVRQNIELALEKPDQSIIDDLLATMQLSAHQHVYAGHLSLGMARRVAIIRAFAVNPTLLLMDEPFVSLDAPTARQVRELLVQLWQQRPHTILFVTHDLREAISLADRLVFLSSSPMQTIGDIRVNIPRTGRGNAEAIENFWQDLLANYTHIRQLL